MRSTYEGVIFEKTYRGCVRVLPLCRRTSICWIRSGCPRNGRTDNGVSERQLGHRYFRALIDHVINLPAHSKSPRWRRAEGRNQRSRRLTRIPSNQGPTASPSMGLVVESESSPPSTSPNSQSRLSQNQSPSTRTHRTSLRTVWTMTMMRKPREDFTLPG